MNASLRDGFTLPLVLMVIGLLALGLAMSIPSTMQLSKGRQRATVQLTAQRAGISAESRLKFLLLTEPVGVDRLEIGAPKLAADGSLVPGSSDRRGTSLVFDGRPYQIELIDGTKVFVRVQDEGGLVNLRNAGSGMVANLLVACGVDGARAQRLAANLVRYRTGVMTNQETTGGFDIRRVAGWNAVLSGDIGRDILSATSHVGPAKSINVRTAPAPVLTAIFGGDRAAAWQYLQARRDPSKLATLNVNNSHFEYNVSQNDTKYANSITRLRIFVEVAPSKLTRHLQMYLYQTAIDIDTARHLRLLMSSRAVFNAGNWSECHQFTGKDIAPLPLMGAASI